MAQGSEYREGKSDMGTDNRKGFSIRFIRSFIHVSATVIFSALAALLLMCAAYSIPLKPIDDHAREAAAVVQDEGTYPKLFPWCTSQLDNWVDSLKIQLASYNKQGGSSVEKALKNYAGGFNGVSDPRAVLSEHYLNGIDYDMEWSYSRYWHGYLVVLKPLLYFFSYSKIRIMNGIVQVALFFLICLLMCRRKHKELIIPWLLTYLMMMPMALAKSLQFSPCFYIMSLSLASLLLLNGENRACWVFLITGMLTSFFDLLTYPAATFGVPAVLYTALYAKEINAKTIAKQIKNGVFWVAGYGGLWLSKWIMGNLLTDRDVIGDALRELGIRTGKLSEDGSRIYGIRACLSDNLKAFFHTPASWLVLFFCVGLLILAVYRLVHHSTLDIKPLIYYCLIILIPFLWYVTARNHSAIHYWFTNKALSITVFSLMCGLVHVLRPTHSQ